MAARRKPVSITIDPTEIASLSSNTQVEDTTCTSPLPEIAIQQPTSPWRTPTMAGKPGFVNHKLFNSTQSEEDLDDSLLSSIEVYLKKSEEEEHSAKESSVASADMEAIWAKRMSAINLSAAERDNESALNTRRSKTAATQNSVSSALMNAQMEKMARKQYQKAESNLMLAKAERSYLLHAVGFMENQEKESKSE